jgi:hypothetical protein
LVSHTLRFGNKVPRRIYGTLGDGVRKDHGKLYNIIWSLAISSLFHILLGTLKMRLTGHVALSGDVKNAYQI